MSEEQAGTSEDFAAMFAGGAKPDHKAVVDAVHPDEDAAQTSAPTEGDGLTANQQRAANEYRLPDLVASRLKGESYDEVEADAQSIVDALKSASEADEPAHVRLAKAAIEAARNNPNQAELAALSRTKPAHTAINRVLHPEDGE